jgi:hypothetical protein
MTNPNDGMQVGSGGFDLLSRLGHGDDLHKQARAEIERLKDALKRVRRVAAEGTTHTGMIAALGILVDRALNPGNGPLPPDYTYRSDEPCEQRGPFAGLQSLSFDVSENPTIALVMRFDNIEHAQAARDQLWQPAGASRDASAGEAAEVQK